ncbi:hypothetical protein [Edaphobacter flagellatus]|uniref:hypothetical protein n=1 Tax=Edaphobacter flagellatus TaxID=1933044 RepID=UPI0021B2EE47|nr:hypothetical protein [Edaphobacter flagellatus]
MPRIFSSLVAVFCLLILFVSSAACLVATPPDTSTNAAMPMQISAPGHECCPPGHDQPQMSASCCTVHHQPAATDCVTIADHQATASAAQSALPVLIQVAAANATVDTSAPLLPPRTLQVLRI